MNSKEMWGRVKSFLDDAAKAAEPSTKRVKSFLDDAAKNPAASVAVGAGGGALAGKAFGVGAGKGATAGALLALLNSNMSLTRRSDEIARRSDEIARHSDEWVDRINKRIDNKARNSMLRDAALVFLGMK